MRDLGTGKKDRPAPTESVLEAAISRHQTGRVAEAKRLCSDILSREPRNAVALHLLGVIAYQQGDTRRAITLIGKAIAIMPDYAEAHKNLGIALQDLGKLDEAVASYRKALTIKPDDAAAHNNLGNALKNLGKLGESVASYHKALAIKPNDVALHNNLGNALKGLGMLDEAVASYHKALAIKPDHAKAHNNLGTVLQDLGKLDEAVARFHQALAIEPNFFEALNNLGLALTGLGKLDEAAACFHKALTIEPDDAAVHNNFGNALRGLGKADDAVASYRKALAIEPDDAAAQNNLGLALMDLGKLDEAVACYRKVLAIRPDDAAAHNNLGNALKNLGKADEAVASYRKALAIEPHDTAVHNNLGTALKDLGKVDEAVASYRRALAIKPNDAAAHNNLGNSLKGLGKLDDAIASYRKALATKPDDAMAHNNLGSALKDLGMLDEAVASFHQALAIEPDYTEAHSNLVFCMNYGERYSQQDIFAESRRWEAAHAAPSAVRKVSHTCDRDPERRLRIGYVSPDFRIHSVAYFLDPLIGGHDRRRFEVFCYAQVANPDDVTQRFRGLADGWCSTVGMTAPAMAERVRADKIDILVDLAGHTANNRLLAFAELAAPVQVSYLGYPNTTGLSAMGYRLTDDIADPEGPGGDLHSETLMRLPNGFLCFAPDVEAPAIAEPPALANGFVTFGSFNNLSKVTPATVAAWARILEGVPESRLLLKSRSLANEGTQQRYRALFAERGVDGKRLEFHARIASKSGHLGAYGRVDIGLDTFPYNGTTTTCEALWMGVPVVTFRGDRHASRVGASILTRVGLGELIADTIDGYVMAAVTLAKAPSRLVELRRDLRPTMAASPLCDAAGFTHAVEAAYRKMWRRWCQGA